jgi:uncharacterized protein YjdB
VMPAPPPPTPPPPPPPPPPVVPQHIGPVAASVTIAPDTLTFTEAGATWRLTATVRDSSGAPMTGAPPLTWTSSDTSVAQVTPSGLVMGLANGTARIGARTGTISGSATVTVRLPGRPTRPTRRPNRRPPP